MDLNVLASNDCKKNRAGIVPLEGGDGRTFARLKCKTANEIQTQPSVVSLGGHSIRLTLATSWAPQIQPTLPIASTCVRTANVVHIASIFQLEEVPALVANLHLDLATIESSQVAPISIAFSGATL